MSRVRLAAHDVVSYHLPAFPAARRLQCSLTYPSPASGVLEGSPRAPLPPFLQALYVPAGCPPLRPSWYREPRRPRPALPDLPGDYGRMRQTCLLCTPRPALVGTVFASCGEPLLERGPSRRDRCPSVPACLDPCLPPRHRPSPRQDRVGAQRDAVRRLPYGAHFEAAVMHSCAGPQVCSPSESGH
jgi:hypothetical protein